MTILPKPRKICILTVGRTPDPLISSLKFHKPDYAYFIVSKDEVDDEGKDVKSTRDQVPFVLEAVNEALPHDFIEVPADEPDSIFSIVEKAFREIHDANPKADVIVDYTGGTKSMSAMVLMASLQQKGFTTQFMEGKRASSNTIIDGTERPHVTTSQYITAHSQWRQALTLMERYEYAAAHLLLEALVKDKTLKVSPLYPIWRWQEEAMAILALWDNFDHQKAYKRLSNSRLSDVRVFFDQRGYTHFLAALAQDAKEGKPSWLRCADLWFNAQRCATKGHYDDAMARLYRLSEAVLQAELWLRYGKTDKPKIDDPDLPDTEKQGLTLRNECYVLARKDKLAWLRHLAKNQPIDIVVAFEKDKTSSGYSYFEERNHSILAHGFQPIKKDSYHHAAQWTENFLVPLWQKYKYTPIQLPQHF